MPSPLAPCARASRPRVCFDPALRPVVALHCAAHGLAHASSSSVRPRDALSAGRLRRAARGAAFLAVPYLGFAALLAAAEAATRVALPYVPSLDVLVSSPLQQAQFVDERHVRIFEGDPLLFWRLRPGLRDAVWDRTPVTTNRQGLRYGRDVGPKAPRCFRIACFGDSVTFGFRVPFVFMRDQPEYDRSWLPYPARIEGLLRDANPGRTIEVLPLAVPGYSSHQGLAWLRRDLDRYDPDVVTLLFGWNDISLRAVSDAAAMKTDAWDVADRAVLTSSQALIHLWRWLHRTTAAAASARIPRVSAEDFVANYEAMVRLAVRRGARVIAIGPVYRDPVEHPDEADRIGRYRALLAERLRRDAVPYLEVPALTEAAYPRNEHLFLEHIHPNHRGHRVLARALVDFMTSARLLGDLRPPAPDAAETEAP